MVHCKASKRINSNSFGKHINILLENNNTEKATLLKNYISKTNLRFPTLITRRNHCYFHTLRKQCLPVQKGQNNAYQFRKDIDLP